MVERSAALGVRRIGGQPEGDSHDEAGRCSSKDASSCKRLGLSRARDPLLFAVLAYCGWRDWTCVSSEHDPTADFFQLFWGWVPPDAGA